MSQPAVLIQDANFSYNGQPVLTDVNLAIEQGDFCAVIGPNGGGKTTLIKLMMGLLSPDSGAVRLLGGNPKKAWKGIGYVPQHNGVPKQFPITVLEVARMGAMEKGRFRARHTKAGDRQVREALERMEVWAVRDRRMGELSGGQRQRVFIARALVSEPRLLLMDEPAANVDAKGQDRLYTLLKELNQKATIVVVSHDFMAISCHVKSVACVNKNVHFHDAAEVTPDMLDMAYGCPVELVAHGDPHRIPHRVLKSHKDE